VHNKIPGKPAIYRPFWDFSLLDVSKTGLYDNEISFAILHSEVSVNCVVIKRYCHRSYQGKLSQKEIPIEYDSYTKKEGEGS